MTYTELTKTELANVFTVDSPDDAPSVDGNGDPRFLDSYDFPIDDDELASVSWVERDEVIQDFERDLWEWACEVEAMRYGY